MIMLPEIRPTVKTAIIQEGLCLHRPQLVLKEAQMLVLQDSDQVLKTVRMQPGMCLHHP